MNADPDEGQPTTVPEATTAETVPPENSDIAESSETPGSPDLGAAEAESGALESDDAEADDAAADEAEADEAEADDAEPEAETAEPEPEAETESEPEPESEPESEPEVVAADRDPEPELEAEPEAEPEPEPEAEPEPEPIAVPATAAAKRKAAQASPTPPASSSTPLVANRYRLVSEIGGGAMGVVWRARDEVLGRDVAVKELRPDHGMSGAQVRISHQRARREGRIAARLQHPNAVVIYDVAEHDGRPYLIMEYVPSQSLGDILATGAVLTPTEVTSIGAQLASALTAAHERGIVHRDIKPGNVLMTTDGTVKLTDFGISRAAGDATVTATGEILGTPAYTAPEVAQGHPVAFPADVFSLGATLYAAAEGIPPFGEDANAMATLLRVVRNEIRPAKRSGPLTDTIMWMLNPEPADRPTMKQVWLGLDAQSAKPGIGIAATPPQTKAFTAPSPTLVVPEPVLNSPRTGPASATPPPRPETEPRRAEAEAAPALSPTPTPAPAPTPTPTPTSGLGAVPATTGMSPAPTSAMIQNPSRRTRKPVPSAATPPDGTPPPASKLPAAAEAAPPPARRSRSRMPLAVGVLVIGTTVLVVAIVVAMNSGKHSPPNQPVAHGSTTSAASSPAKPTATTASRPSTTPSSVPSSSSPPSSSTPTPASTTPTDLAGQLSSFLTNYYSLLPAHQDQAFNSLTSAYQTNTAQGRSGYAAWWNSIDHVELKEVVAKAPSTVTATIYYYFKNGTRTAERTVFGLTQDGSTFKIASSSVQTSQPF